MARNRVVAFDLMDTLVRDPYREALRAAFGDRLREAMADRDTSTWPAFESGAITEDEFWSAHAEWEPDLVAFDRARRDGTTWLPGMRELLGDLRRSGARVVIASNYPSWIVDLEERMLTGLVDEVVASCRVGARKPDPAFYDAVVLAADTTPEAITFVDDRQVNVDAAQQAGLDALLFTAADEVRDHLEAVGLLG